MLSGGEFDNIYSNEGVPVYNDNIIYSILKYETLTEKTVKEILGEDDEDLNKKKDEGFFKKLFK